ncbi:O-methyltransferase-domain-containing protein [Apiosordaria backusii]|uniref:O-methyltransferase-domain-containing protein n=1 Tax=Apiosordaria backusii TaxID=314023 RepID=A0AA40AIG4_9PEZI|nr:O-methyltransferase-domain-containing protein [Apiosordaria backusii]
MRSTSLNDNSDNMGSNPPPLTHLAQEIAKHASIITTYLQSHNLPQPSFASDSPAHPIPETDEKLSAARLALIEATKALHALAIGPSETTRLFAFTNLCHLGTMQVLCHFNVPQNVPLGSPISLNELSTKTKLNEHVLGRFLRMAATNYFFVETKPGYFSHTAWSKNLATDEKMRQCIWFRHAELLPAVGKLVEAVEKYPESDDPKQTAFALAFGGETFFDYKESNPDNMVRFGQFVDAFASGYVVDSPDNIARGYPWEDIGRSGDGGLVVDVGGGIGHISVAIGKEHSQLRFLVQDFEDLRKQSESLVLKNGLMGRVKFMAHDFFNGQPEEARGASVYFLRNILHNWSDSYCQKILKLLVEAMGKDSRIIICDIVLPEANGGMPKAQEERARALDLTMLSMFNAKERSLEEWQALFSSVDERLKITNVIGRPKMRMDCLIEVRLM